jgi:hypothetical protein
MRFIKTFMKQDLNQSNFITYFVNAKQIIIKIKNESVISEIPFHKRDKRDKIKNVKSKTLERCLFGE